MFEGHSTDSIYNRISLNSLCHEKFFRFFLESTHCVSDLHMYIKRGFKAIFLGTQKAIEDLLLLEGDFFGNITNSNIEDWTNL